MHDPIHDSADNWEPAEVPVNDQPMWDMELLDPTKHAHKRGIAIAELAGQNGHAGTGSGSGGLHAPRIETFASLFGVWPQSKKRNWINGPRALHMSCRPCENSPCSNAGGSKCARVR
jgi:hypothetical protein